MLPSEEITQYGGKGAILKYVQEQIPDMPIPPFALISHDDSFKTVKKEFEAMKGPVILRSSSPHEYSDFEGIFESVGNITDVSQLKQAFQRVKESATSERAKLYAEQNGFDLTERIHLILQQQSSSQFNAAMLRHPNNPDLLFIAYHNNGGDHKRDYASFLYDERTEGEGKIDCFFSCDDTNLETAKRLARRYHEIESLKEISDDEVLFVECGHSPFAFYQARPFKKKEVANFEVPQESDETEMIGSSFVFGVTPPEGIVLPVTKGLGMCLGEAPYIAQCMMGDVSVFETGKVNGVLFQGPHDGELFFNLMNYGCMLQMTPGGGTQQNLLADMLAQHNKNVDSGAGAPHCFITTSATEDSYWHDVDLELPNMHAAVLGRVNNFMQHGLMRLMKKAEVTVGQNSLMQRDFYKDIQSIDDKVRIISNGKEAVVMKE